MLVVLASLAFRVLRGAANDNDYVYIRDRYTIGQHGEHRLAFDPDFQFMAGKKLLQVVMVLCQGSFGEIIEP